MSPAPRGVGLAAVALLAVSLWLAGPGGAASEGGSSQELLRFEWIVGSSKRVVEMRPLATGGYAYRLQGGPDGDVWLDAERFQTVVAETTRRQVARPAFLRAVNASSWRSFLWVLVGLGGQLCFFGRMGLQWWASERAGRSVVPPVFWWLSLFGSGALLSYFVWRLDPIGILGQSTGTLVYARNLWLLRKAGGAERAVQP